MEYLYHGSKIQGLKKLEVDKKRKEKIYATSNEAFAAIFINRVGGSLLASWGRLENKIPYFCERKRGIFNSNYKNRSGSIYKVDKKYFEKNKDNWKEEWESAKEVPVVEEIKISDIKKYLLKLRRQEKLEIIFHKDRLKFFPNLDKDLEKMVKKLIKKYGKEKILSSLKKYHPRLAKQIV